MVNGYLVPFTCPNCGGNVTHVADGRPVAGTEAAAVCQCTVCQRRWHLLVTARPAITPDSVTRRTYREKANA